MKKLKVQISFFLVTTWVSFLSLVYYGYSHAKYFIARHSRANDPKEGIM